MMRIAFIQRYFPLSSRLTALVSDLCEVHIYRVQPKSAIKGDFFPLIYLFYPVWEHSLPCQRLKTRVRVELLVKKWFSLICFTLLLNSMSDIIMSEDHFVASSSCIFTAALQCRSSDCKAKWSFFFFIWFFVGFACIAPTWNTIQYDLCLRRPIFGWGRRFYLPLNPLKWGVVK